MSTDTGRSLRDVLQDQPQHEPPADFLGGVHSRIQQRNLRRRMFLASGGVGLAGVITVAALLAVSAASNQPATLSPGAGAVPWVNRPASLHQQPTTQPQSNGSSLYPSCTAAQLSAAPGPYTLGTGHITQQFNITNSGSSACSLAGAPSSISGTDSNGHRATLLEDGSLGDYGLVSPANLEPGDSAELFVLTSLQCPAAAAGDQRDLARVSIALPGKGALAVAMGSGRALHAACPGAGISNFVTVATAPASTASPYDGLTGEVSFPSPVSAGSTLTYYVTLSNPTDHDIDMSNCPAYTQFIVPAGAAPEAGESAYYLNCDQASSIPSGGSATFEMKIPAPATAGTAKYGWQLQNSSLRLGGTVDVSSPN